MDLGLLYFSLIILFLLGVSVGSFINVLVDRHDRLSSVLSTRSHCPSCKRDILPYDLVPVLSYIILRGKCRFCQAQIPLRLAVVEMCVGGLFVLVGILHPQIDLSLVLLLGIVSVLAALFFVDAKYYILPDYLLVLLLILAIVLQFAQGTFDILTHVGTGVGLFLLFLLLFVLTRGRGIGFGDVKFAFVIGVLSGFPGGAVAVYLAFVTGAVFSISMILAGKKKLRGETIPFGPFLVIGVLSVLLFSEWIYLFLSRIY